LTNIKDNLFKLSAAVAVGNVTEASDKAYDILSQYVKCERLGGLSFAGTLSGKSDYTLMLDAHIDEIAMVVTNIDDKGFLTVAKCGGIDLRTLPLRQITVHGKEKVSAVFCGIPPHLSEKEKEYKDISELKIDSLLGDKAKNIISVGDYVTFSTKPIKLAGGCISGKSLDDRAGVCCLIELAKRLKDKELPFNVTFCISDSEELGLRGAKTAAFKLKPDEAIAIDVSFGDGPDISPDDCGKLSFGAMIGISPILNTAISNKLIEIANKKHIKYQTEVMGGTTSTNSDVISVNREGVKTGLVSIPLRNMHTEVEVVNIDDILYVCDMLEEYILSGGIMNA